MRRAHTGHTVFGQEHQGGDVALETENDRMADELSGKIKSLRSITIEMRNEVGDQNRFLRDMDDDFDGATGFLGKAMGRVKKLSKGSHNHIVLYLILFSLFVFFLIWVILKIS